MEPEKNTDKPSTSFKKPVLVGKIGRFPKKLAPAKTTETEATEPEDIPVVQDDVPHENPPESSNESVPAEKDTSDINNSKQRNAAYKEPNWSALPKSSEEPYSLEVLKNGSIIDNVNLMDKPYWVFGRLVTCDICMQHPTISRNHAVLQYREDPSNAENTGFYIYDLESTHGTFLNKMRIRPRAHIRVQVGFMLKLGCSTRTYILTGGPTDAADEENTMTITEMKAEFERRKRERLEKEELERKKREEGGIDWGLGEDADEETDLSHNPFAQTNNEELYIENPKKALRGFFEREGLELDYDCSEQGIGQFMCRVELPLDDELGRPIKAEVIHKGKKKEAVVQCALEACRILDRHGVLRQATHESHKRKPKNWEDNDYYDSDEDTFLDRTGHIEKKRAMRMKVPQKVETYDTLVEKEKSLSDSIRSLESKLAQSQHEATSGAQADASGEVDSLDSFMLELKNPKTSKHNVNKLKQELLKFKQEHTKIVKLVNMSKPASLPALISTPSSSENTKKIVLPAFGKRKKVKLDLPKKADESSNGAGGGDEEENESEEEIEAVKAPKREKMEKEEQPTTSEKMETQEEPKSSLKSVEAKASISESSKPQKAPQTKPVTKTKVAEQKKRAKQTFRKEYEETDETFSMWVPPSNQSGDGRTALNDKYNY